MENKHEQLRQIGQKETTVNLIIKEIKGSIENGTYKAGMKLPNETDLATEMGVSRTSIREAMKVLSALSIVEIKRGDGTYICSKMDPSLFDSMVYSIIYASSTSEELQELRQILDEATVQLACKRATEEEIENMQRNIDYMRVLIKHGDGEKMRDCDMEFHMMMIESCKNAFFIRIMKGVYDILKYSISESVNTEKVDSLAADYHQEMLDCIKNKSYYEIHDAVKHSLTTWKNRV